jgi:thymidylate synthase ThyX
MTETTPIGRRRRVYPLDAHELTEEQIAVAFAMTSRRPEPFDEIAKQVSQEKAADFHERWVVGYGHASVAEHAVLHLAVEDISRLACDTLEDNRLASYTEKSSRYQLLPSDYFFHPPELANQPALSRALGDACRELFQVYHRLVEGCVNHLRGVYPQEAVIRFEEALKPREVLEPVVTIDV